MTNNKVFLAVETFVTPIQCLNDVVQSCTDYLRIKAEEQTKRDKIEAREKIILAEIKAKRDFIISYLEHSFDERANNFRSLFEIVDQAIYSEDNEQLSLALQAILQLAESSPFKNLTDLSTVKAALNDPEHLWEF